MLGGRQRCEVLFLRVGLFVGLLSAVVTVIYLTPVPDLQFASCDRPCHELDWPMICRFRLVLEQHQSMGGWCGDCPKNLTHCFRYGCVIAEGLSRRILTANKQLPGPAIQVCENDILVVDVVNRLPGQGVAIHWRGQRQTESPYMDGVPMITQCPISSYTTFQYKFRASEAGTHLWHSHTGNEFLDGIFGPLIVRKADRMEEHRSLYDVDSKEHIVVLTEWGSGSFSDFPILVNGVYNKDKLMPKLHVTPGLRHRIRVMHAGGGTSCPFYVSVVDHQMLVIALDGRPIKPILTDNVVISQGERFDFVLSAFAEPKDYNLEVRANCTKMIGLAGISYNTTALTQSQPHLEVSPLGNQITAEFQLLSTLPHKDCNKDSTVCLNEISSIHDIIDPLNRPKMDVTLYLPFDYLESKDHVARIGLIPRLNNITFAFPSSPLLSQPNDINVDDQLCTDAHLPDRCSALSPACECTQIVNIPLKSSVEIIMINKDKFTTSDHVFHLHGHSFRAVGFAENVLESDLEKIKELDKRGELMERNLVNAVEKDTITVPKNGAVAMRFKASRPGYWLLHDQSATHWVNGLDILFKVGEPSDLPPIPENFPKCGSWVGPQFFLI
ncbi:Multicopper oxidase [Nesidiocoris tenuis]|uniref:Multicopper oxidase n=1 Tax=Nesidiocoris tenuis TaxID=355587 RepID=A0ABN7AYN6_9HEMI|nr:Multicopper oxidase [Nesidiocoris tenuis]